MTAVFILRIFVAGLLGGAIGLEREYRAKEAGFRTHFLVALGSSLFTIISAYGFSDITLGDGIRYDVSRIAAQVVSGIGFIGAGCIIFQRHAVRGLTTAAGLWVTAAIGMAAGAGMYAVSTVATIMVVVCLELMIILHDHIFPHRHVEDDDSKEE
jgi:putative Mg2+ transporter-C (MgtC) family protein